MSKYYIISTLILISCDVSIAQFLWLEGLEESRTIEHVAGHKMEVLPSNKYLNHHPMFYLNESVEKIIPNFSSGLTIFSVTYVDHKSNEQLIWKINQDDQDRILHTTQRTANLQDGRFINYTLGRKETAQITTYYLSQPFRHNETFQLASTPKDHLIPVQRFSGHFAEVIAFEKVLSPLSIQIVQSILALKYSLKLPSNHDYVGLHGERLWQTGNNTFHHQIGGIGRLDELHFDQSISTTDLNQGSFTISTEGHGFEDNSFVLWADDGNAIKYNEFNGVKTLDRTWQIRNIRTKDPKVRITIKHNDLIHDINKNESFYGIAKSENGTMIFPLQGTEQNTITGHVALQQEKTTFQVARGPSFWSYLQISEPSCDKTLEGAISGQIIGGQAPYHIVVEHDEYKTTSFITDKNSFDHNITTGGKYKLTITDKNHQKWKTILIINYKDIPKPDLSNVYYLTEKNIQITPYNPIPHDIHLEWILPDGRYQFSDNLKPSQSGQYTLKVSNVSCENRYDFELINNANNIIDARVFPNPSASFRQYLTANLERAAPYRITITSQDGRLIASEDFQASQYIFQEFSLNAGIYIISLHVGNAVSSHPLIVLQN